MSSFELYFLLMLDSLHDLVFWSGLIIIIFCALFAIVLCFGLIEDIFSIEDVGSFFKKVKNPIISVFLIGPFLFCSSFFIPSTKQMAVIYLLPKLINNQKIQDIGNDTLNILERLTKDYISKYLDEKIQFTFPIGILKFSLTNQQGDFT